MNTTASFDKTFILKNIRNINAALEQNDFISWYFGFDDTKETFFFSVFDEHNPQEELVFTVSESPFEIVSGYRYKKVKRSVIKEEHVKYQEANKALAFVTDFLQKK